MDWLTATQSFVMLSEYKSFTKAAEQLNISPSSMSKRIDWLERNLGISLFTRTTRQVNVSEAGQLFLPKAQSFIAQYQDIISHSQHISKTPAGTLKIAATLAVGSNILMPNIQTFLAEYSQVTIQLDVLTPGAPPELEHDLVFTRQYENFNSPNYKGTRLINYQMHLFAAPNYLNQHPEISCVEDLAEHKMLLTNYYQKLGYINLQDGRKLKLNNFNFVSDHLDSMLEAAVQGMGLIFIAPSYVRKQLAAGNLVPVLPEIRSEIKQLWAYYPSNTFTPLKTRLFIDHLKRAMSDSTNARKAETNLQKAKPVNL